MTFAAKHVTKNPFAFHVEANHASTVARARATIIMASALAALPILCAPTSGLAMDAGVQRAAVSAGDYPRGIRATPGRTTPPPGRYVAATGQGFILGRQGSLTLLRFDRSNETWVLRASSAPRGDTIYRNDAGEQVLRVTSSGGMTLYSSRSPGGSPVSNAGGTAPSLEPQALGPVQLFNLMTRRSSLISDAVGRLVQINVYGDESEALCVEALIVTTDTVIRIARSPSAKPFLDRMRVITVVEGNRSAVTYQRGELRIVVDPSRGIAGRPSSARIIRAIIPEE